MNPQYVPQQLYGVSQNYPVNRASPQSFQTVPLKSVPDPTPPPDDETQRGQFGLRNGALQFQNGPPSQNFPPPPQREGSNFNLPPTQFGPPPSQLPPGFRAGPPVSQPSATLGPPGSFPAPPSKLSPNSQAPPGQFPPPSQPPSNSQAPPGQFPPPSQPPSNSQAPPGQFPPPSQPPLNSQSSPRQFRPSSQPPAGSFPPPPNSQGQPPNSQGGPGSLPPPNSQGGPGSLPPPNSQGGPGSLPPPNSQGGPGSYPPTSQPPPGSQRAPGHFPPSAQPPLSSQGPPGQFPPTSQRLANSQSPPGQFPSPSTIQPPSGSLPSGPPTSQQRPGPFPPTSQPSFTSPQPPSEQQAGGMNQGPPPPTANQFPPIPNQMPTPNLNQAGLNRFPAGSDQPPSRLNQMPPPSSNEFHAGSGPHLNHPKGGFNQFPPPQNQAQSPPGPNQFRPPPSNQPPLGHNQQKPYPPPPGAQFPPQQQQQQQFSQPPNQFNQPPIPGQRLPPTNQPLHPGMPQPPHPGMSQPPHPGMPQPPLGPNQLSSQMQNMNLGGQRPYAGGMNGDNLPHMPPPMNQQQYINGQQQLRGPPAPGYPPMPGQSSATYPQSPYQQQPQNKKLDPDQMPSPIQVIQDDQRNRSGVFVTNQKGLVPPLVTTDFVVQDQGNCSPRYIRSTMYNVPISQDIMKQTALPFSLAISPMARTVEGEFTPPIVNFGELGPVRCIRCKAYMCPYMQFIDSGRRFQCLFCKATTDVPAEYFQHLDHTGQRMDRFERPELILGAYEFVATSEYCRNNTLPKPPAIVFIIDVSYNNVKSGLVNLLCSQMKEIIQNLPADQGQEKSNMRVGFITYNSSVHFYNIKGSLAAPQMLVVGDTQEMFMPLLDGFLCTPEESSGVIDALMQQIPQMFGDTRETETILLPAILAGLEALKASDCTGKLLVFHSTLPTAEAPGKLKNRDDRKLLGTEKERTVLQPQNQAYNQLGQDCVGSGCTVDLFVFNNAYIDIATIGQVARLTGGEVFKYTYFQADLDGDRLIKDIITDISRPIAFDAVMRVRTSTGIRPTDFYGHFYMSNTTDMELAAIDCDKSVAVEIKHDDKLSEEEGVYIQAALLYTSCSGQRRLRILNLSLKTCSQMADLYKSCDSDTLINYMAKQAVYKLLDNNPKAVKDSLVNRAAQILATYRKNCASPSSAGQLILPECMKLLPLYVNCLLKSDAINGGSDMTIDDRSFVMQVVMTMDIQTSVNYFYPRLIPLHEIDPSQESIEVLPIRCTYEKMNEQGVYLLESGIHMFLWVGLGASPDFTQKVFGAPSAIQVDVERVSLPELDNPLSIAVRNLIEEIRIQRHRCMRLTIVRQREKLEPVFKHFLAEDRGSDGSPSYVDFLIHMHKEIRGLLS